MCGRAGWCVWQVTVYVVLQVTMVTVYVVLQAIIVKQKIHLRGNNQEDSVPADTCQDHMIGTFP